MRHFLNLGRIQRSKVKWIVSALLVVVAALVVGVLFLRDFDWQRVTAAIDRVHPIAALPLMAVLPVFGFPIMFVYLFAGARFGPLLGGGVVAGVTAVHLAASYLIARSFLRGPLERFIERRHHHLPQVPEDEAAAVALVAVLVPGIPYVVRNYVLALTGIRFRIYFWICLPVYVARSYVTILLGDLSSDPNRRGLVIIVAIDVVKVAICALVIWWLRQHHRKFHGHDAPDVAGPPTGAGK
ncbi:MAG: VTT domain-containing protein [Opitutaceae bacterium]|nr:VTT domain-containing protein [Opitutaceae bacterium]